MQRKLLVITGILGALAVALGAFGAHELKPYLNITSYETFQLAVQYQFIHVLALFGIFILLTSHSSKWLVRSSYLFLLGILFFSGSLYLIACRDLIQIIPIRILGPLTPIGGISFILGWICLLLAGLKFRT